VPYDLGDTVRLEADSRDAGGTLTNATTATLTITLPDGTTTSPSVTNPPSQTGQYRVDYATTQAGRHAARWVFTGPASAYTDAFDVREAVPPLIMSLADAKKHLNLTKTDHDDEVRSWVESITAGVEHFAGVCVRRTVAERHDVNGVRTLCLRRTPVLSLTSVVAILSGGTDYAVADLELDGPTGIVQRLDGGRLCGPLRVTYTAGRTVIPAAIRDAAKVILQHLWRTQNPQGRTRLGGEDYAVTEPLPGFGYAIPHRAMQLLEPDRLPPGVA
jgi:hypothetical protein